MPLHYLCDIRLPLVSWMCWCNGCVCWGDIKKDSDWQSARDSAYQHHVSLKCNKCRGVSLPRFFIQFRILQTSRQGLSHPPPYAFWLLTHEHTTKMATHMLAGCLVCLSAFSASLMPLTCLVTLLLNFFYINLVLCPFPLLSFCSLVSCRLQQTPAHFQLCVQNDNKLRQPPACLNFLSKASSRPTCWLML